MGRAGLGVGPDRHRLVGGDAADAKEVRKVELRGRAGLDADRGAVELCGAGDSERRVVDEALAVLVADADEGEWQSTLKL